MKISKIRRIREGTAPVHSAPGFTTIDVLPILFYLLSFWSIFQSCPIFFFFWDILNNYIFHCNGGCVCFKLYKEDYN